MCGTLSGTMLSATKRGIYVQNSDDVADSLCEEKADPSAYWAAMFCAHTGEAVNFYQQHALIRMKENTPKSARAIAAYLDISETISDAELSDIATRALADAGEAIRRH